MIERDALSGSPRELVQQLNTLARTRTSGKDSGVTVSFAPDVDQDCRSMTIATAGKSLGYVLRHICNSCGLVIREAGTNVVIFLPSLPEQETKNLESHVPAGLPKLCAQFRELTGENRYAVADQMSPFLPRCPKTWEKDIGTGVLTGYDYKNPSYVLYKRDVLKLLGTPDRHSNNRKWYYILEPSSSMRRELCITFHEHDYAVSSAVTGSVDENQKPNNGMQADVRSSRH